MDFYRKVLRLRKSLAALRNLSKDSTSVLTTEEHPLLVVNRRTEMDRVLVVANFSEQNASRAVAADGDVWRKVLDSSDVRWMGPGGGVPETLVSASGGLLPLCLNPSSVCVLQRTT